MFDTITKDDLIVAFYPCIYFCALSQVAMTFGCVNYKKLTDVEKLEKIFERQKNRFEFLIRLEKFVGVCLKRNIRMVFENPWSMQTYLKANFLKSPDIVDMDRTIRGDIYVKPTAYWFWNCTPTHGNTYEKSSYSKKILYAKKSSKTGVCSEERSMIHPNYAKNWIKDFIIGPECVGANQRDLFSFMEATT